MRRLPQIVVGLAGALLLLLLVIALLPEPQPEREAAPIATRASPSPVSPTAVALLPSPTRTVIPTPAFSPLRDAHGTVDLASSSVFARYWPTPAAGDLLWHAFTRRGPLALRLLLDDEPLLAGQIAQAVLMLENQGHERLRDVSLQLALTIGAGNVSFYPMLPNYAEPPLPSLILPGETISQTVRFYVPDPRAFDAVELYVWGTATFTRDNGVVQEAVRRQIEVGPVVLGVEQAPPERQIQAELETDEEGWTLRLVSPDPAEQPPGLEGGAREFNWFVLDAWPLAHSAEGVWRGRWLALDDRSGTSAGWNLSTLLVAVVAAPGYASALITHTVNLSSAPLPPTPPPAPPLFTSFAEAQAALPFVLVDPRRFDPAAQLQAIEVLTTTLSDASLSQVHQDYLLSNGWLRVEQIYKGQLALQGYFQHSFPEPRPFSFPGGTGLAVRALGVWHLEWETVAGLYRLEVPAFAFSFEQAGQLAAQLSGP